MEALAQMIDAKVDALKVELFEQFQTYLDGVLVDMAAKYELDLETLQKEYLMGTGISTPVSSEKPKRVRKAKADTDTREKCQAKTAKGAPCKNMALSGGVFCACHSKATKKTGESRVDKIRKGLKKGGVKPVSPPSSDSESDEESVHSPAKVPVVPVVSEPPKRPKRPVRKAAAKAAPAKEESESDEESVKSPVKVPVTDEVEELSAEMKSQLDALFGDDDEDEDEE